MNKIISKFIAGALVSAVAYTSLFYFNNWSTSHLAYSPGVSWIYLPAGLRLFMTLIFGLPAALGISVASFLICYFGEFPAELTTCIGVGLISGFAPYLSKIFVLSNLKISSDLSNLSLPKLAICTLIYSAFSAGLHQWWFSIRGLDETGSLNHFVVMFIGDVLGTIMLVGLIKVTLDLFRSPKPA